MPIRLRLTLWFGLLLGVTLGRDFDQTLRVRAAQVERELAGSSEEDGELTPDEIRPADLEPDALEDFAEPGVYVQVLSVAGEVLATSGTLLPVDGSLVS